VAQVGATHADLLVLGTHGKSGFQRLFLGSVTEKVIRKAPCPTLVVPPRAPDVHAGSPIQFRRILCPVDFSESALDAMIYALNMAQEADATLTLLHVVEFSPVLSETSLPAPDLSRVREAAAADARRRLHAFIPESTDTYCTVETAVVEGRAYREILRKATELQSDLIVMGVHGRGALDRSSSARRRTTSFVRQRARCWSFAPAHTLRTGDRGGRDQRAGKVGLRRWRRCEEVMCFENRDDAVAQLARIIADALSRESSTWYSDPALSRSARAA